MDITTGELSIPIKEGPSPEEYKKLEKENALFQRKLRALQLDYDYLRINFAQAEQMRDKNAKERELQFTYNTFFLENSPNFTIIFDNQLNCVLASPKVWDFLHIPKNKNIAMEPFRSIFTYSPLSEAWLNEIEHILRATMETKAQFTREEQITSAAGAELTVQTLVVPIMNKEQECIGVSLIQNDITEITTARHKAEEASRLKAEFMANMSHEIRPPLNAIIGMTYLSLRQEMPASVRDYIAKAHTAANSLLGIINDILDFSKIEAGKFSLTPEPFQLGSFFESTRFLFESQCQEKNIALVFNISPDVPGELVGDTLRLSQIVNNIMGNALKFTSTGHIKLSCNLFDIDAESVTLAFAIEDTGIGIAKEFQEKLFRPFSQEDGSRTRKYGGTGLGLTITRMLVEMMQGSIAVASEPNVGTTISFTCRFGKTDASTTTVNEKHFSFVKILTYASSSAMNIELHNKLSRNFNHIDVASSLEDASRLLGIAEEKNEPYSLAILDADGMEQALLDEMRAFYEGLKLESRPKLLMLYPRYEQKIATLLEQRVIDNYFVKPVKAAELYGCVNELVYGDQSIEEEKSSTSSDAVAFSGQRVLLVEDNIINQQIALELLESVGLDVTVADNGKRAVEAVNAQATTPPFDIILMDLQMPEMDGFEAMRNISAQSDITNMPVIAMTAHVLEDERAKCREAGMVDHVAKPIVVEHLYGTLKKYLG